MLGCFVPVRMLLHAHPSIVAKTERGSWQLKYFAQNYFGKSRPLHYLCLSPSKVDTAQGQEEDIVPEDTVFWA